MKEWSPSIYEKRRTDVNDKGLLDIFFRISMFKINHERRVEQFMDYLGNVAGIGGLLFQIAQFVMGYSEYLSRFSVADDLTGLGSKIPRSSFQCWLNQIIFSEDP